MKLLLMSQKEIDRLDIVKRVLSKEVTSKHAAQLLKLTERQIWNLATGVKKHGARALVHGNRGRPSNRRIPDKERARAVALIQRHYSDFGPTFASEKLEECHGIKRDAKTIRSIMIAEDIWKPKIKKKFVHRSWRQRKVAYGEMQQFDGSYEHWFEDRAPKCCLLASIDDATGIITYAKFGKNEGVVPVFKFWKEYIVLHGKPRSIYLDRFSTYKMNARFAKDNHDLKTQFERAMLELKIEPITAHSPEAKGRVERLFKTLQDRLIKEMRLRGVSSIDEANRFLEEYIPTFNAKFSVKPVSLVNMHKALTIAERKKLDSIFSRHYTRVMHNDYTISFNKIWYQLTEKQPVTVFAKDTVIVEEHLDTSIHIRLRGKYLNKQAITKRSEIKEKAPWVIAASIKEETTPVKKQWKPAQNHPWRQYEKIKEKAKI